jgi:UDP-arabinose 4-epimerase
MVRWGPLVVEDILDTSSVCDAIRAHGVKAVVHFAASAYVGDSVRDPAAYYRNNLLGTLSVLDAMRQSGVRDIVFSSSCSVYGNPVKFPIDESHPVAPLSPYGQTKLDGENAIRWYSRAYGLRSVCLRYFNAAGADPDGEVGEDHDPETRLVPRAILAALGVVPPLEIFGDDYDTPDGTAVRDYVHVADLAVAHVRALQRLGEFDVAAILNLGTGQGYSVREVVSAVGAELGRPVPHRLVARRAGDPAKVVADASRAFAALGWAPRHSGLFTIVASACQWHRKRHEVAA